MGRIENTVIEESKKYISSFYVNGAWLKNPIRVVENGKEVSDQAMNFLNEFYHVLLEGNIISKYSIIWVTSSAPSIKEALEYYNRQHSAIEQLNVNTALADIRYDKKRLKSFGFSGDYLYLVLCDPDKYITDAKDKLNMIARKYMKDSEYKDATVLRLRQDLIRRGLDNFKFKRLVDNLERYSKSYINKINNGESEIIDEDMIGYYNYLISSQTLSKEESRRLKQIRAALGLDKDNNK